MTATYEGWTAVELTLPSGTGEDDERVDALGSALFELGAAGLETKERDGRTLLVASYAPDADLAAVLGALAAVFDQVELAGVTVRTEVYAPIDWANHWRQHFHAIAFDAPSKAPAAALWVVPTWLEPPADARHVLRIDPSSAFGTGLHATTAMCMERVVSLSPIDAVLDVGTGTGILALAALELGARRAVATDNDPEALRVAEENAARNGCSGRLVVSGEDPGALGERFDVVVANILARPLMELASELVKAVKPGGRVVLSGITRAQVDDVVAAYEAEGLTRGEVETREEWARVELTA